MSLKLSFGAAACAVLFASAAQAQSTLFNVHLGPSYAWRTANEASSESKGMLSAGGGGGFSFGKGALSFSPSIFIVGKSTKMSDPTTGGETRLKLQYIEFPLLAIVTPMQSKAVRPFFGAGPVVDLEMRCRVEFVVANSKDEVGCDLQSSSTFDRHKVDLAVAGIAGVDYRLSENRRLSLDVRYTHGLRNISDSDDRALQIHNRAVSVYLGYSFPLKADM